MGDHPLAVFSTHVLLASHWTVAQARVPHFTRQLKFWPGDAFRGLNRLWRGHYH